MNGHKGGIWIMGMTVMGSGDRAIIQIGMGTTFWQALIGFGRPAISAVEATLFFYIGK